MTPLVKALVLFQTIFAFLCVLQSTAELVNLGNVAIDTAVGKVRGQSLTLAGDNHNNSSRLFYSFLGIPYAKRFRAQSGQYLERTCSERTVLEKWNLPTTLGPSGWGQSISTTCSWTS
ncbi:hypothetical protein JTE90_024899 [Oedothorax gibbosus]|uniref:Uncharacterized protein n=1 Tax=Oedothorax gibbosus TaxID=931172 RepID=A0AAV6TTU5_9ARAC|nr:hypothetical protein JTE90_024899 [Oedothorax gibbosus]